MGAASALARHIHRVGRPDGYLVLAPSRWIPPAGGPGDCHHCCTSSPRRDSSDAHTSELKSLMRISYAVFCLNKKHFLILRQKPRCTHQQVRYYKNPTIKITHSLQDHIQPYSL